MRTMNSNFREQWAKPMISLYDYLPTKYEASAREWAVRSLIWDFKDGKRSKEVAKKVAECIREHWGSFADTLCFVCIPAHDDFTNTMRYEEFSREVCHMCDMYNGFSHIRIEGERWAIHESHSEDDEKDFEKVFVVDFDRDYFNGKRVIIFDDILTTGKSYARLACQLEEFGADVMGGYFLGRTLMK